MTEHSPIKQATKRKAAPSGAESETAHSTTAPPSKSTTIAAAATRTGRAIGKTGMRVAKPLAASIKHENNSTLAKMVIAAITPKLVNAALRFAIRNPVLSIAGVLVVAAVVGAQEDDSAEA